ncbi:hypothetical protein [Absidia glauca]|uniref:DDE-1 domain-containing protein n=1 Tax=Absidia glauca TaxID=4829 RepID=A0A163KHS9_ABSGL|nr:hypothetical protein [Absidia glauca]
MMEHKKRMDGYSGDEEENVVDRIDKSGPKKVFVTHDESIFYANDGQDKSWYADHENRLAKKGQGLSVMVSEYQCPCHGTMRDLRDLNNVKTSRQLFYPGVNREGYWQRDDMVKQLNEVIPLFEYLHPGCQGVFVFDQSSNHNALPDDALYAPRMTLRPKKVTEKDQHIFRCTFFYHASSNTTVRQPLYAPLSGSGENQQVEFIGSHQKIRMDRCIIQFLIAYHLSHVGIKMISQQRGLWIGSLKLTCNGEEDYTNHLCCARHLLANQPDFRAQKTAIQEIVEFRGHIFDLYPKFHCECNWIERYWGAAKREARMRCDYTFRLLKANIDDVLDTISPLQGPPTKIRRYNKRCWRYIEAYSQGNDIVSATKVVEQFSSRKYKSHRRPVGSSD